MLTLEELKEVLCDHLDPDDIVEALEISTEELLDMFEDKLRANRYKFLDYEEDYIDEYQRGED